MKDLSWALERLDALRAYLGNERSCSAGLEKTKECLGEVLPVIDEAITALNNIAGALVVAGIEFGPGGSHVRPEWFRMTADQILSVLGEDT